VQSELDGMRLNPVYEFNEMVQLLEHEGVNQKDALVIAQKLQQNPKSYQRTMVEKELGLEIEPNTLRLADSVAMAFSYLLASIVHLIAYFFFPVKEAYMMSLILSLLFLIMLGLLRGRMAKIHL
jgi:VIT1/CCC1 family predicted Fe2+/Mn2+ transporter